MEGMRFLVDQQTQHLCLAFFTKLGVFVHDHVDLFVVRILGVILLALFKDIVKPELFLFSLLFKQAGAHFHVDFKVFCKLQDRYKFGALAEHKVLAAPASATGSAGAVHKAVDVSAA